MAFKNRDCAIMSAELDFLVMLREGAPLGPGARGLIDDAALIELGEITLVLTQDTMVENVHVLKGMESNDIAWRLVAANVSDLAAKGAEPVGALLSHSTSPDDAAFVAGLSLALNAYGVPLLGGDTVRMPDGSARVWSLTAIGRATHAPVPSRCGAQVGDGLYVTGALGAAMMGFEALRDRTGADSSAYRRPQARLAEGQALAPLVTAMMDISDGLLLDAWRMGTASGVTMAIDSASVPIAVPEDRRDEALRWGDDYELLFTAPADTGFPCPVHRIGAVRTGKVPLELDGEPIADPEGLGYQH